MIARGSRNRLLVGVIAVIVVLGILSVVMTFVGHGHSGLTHLFPR